MDRAMLELYTDFLITSTRLATATGLSEATGGQISHDQVTRFLSREEYTQEDFWKLVKPIVREVERDDGILAIDDTIEKKPYTDENEMVCYHYDHVTGKSVRGINLLTLFYSGKAALPIRYEVVRKKEKYIDAKTGKEKRRSDKNKNELFREMLQQVHFGNHVRYGYVVGDSWFASSANLAYIHKKLGKTFIFAMKSNRTAALSKKDQSQGNFIPISQIECQPGQTVPVWLKDLFIPVVLVRQTFMNKDGSSGTLFLVCNDTALNADEILSLYQKRWKIEEYHKSLKQNASLEKSPTKIVRTQQNHIFASVVAYVKLELLRMHTSLNHFAIKSKIYLSALQNALAELFNLRHRLKIAVAGA